MPFLLPPSYSHSTVIGKVARGWWRLAVLDAIPDLPMPSVRHRVTTRIRPRAVAHPREARLLDRRTTGAVDVEGKYCLDCHPSSSEVPGVERDSFVREPSTSAQSRSRNPSPDRRVRRPGRIQTSSARPETGLKSLFSRNCDIARIRSPVFSRTTGFFHPTSVPKQRGWNNVV